MQLKLTVGHGVGGRLADTVELRGGGGRKRGTRSEILCSLSPGHASHSATLWLTSSAVKRRDYCIECRRSNAYKLNTLLYLILI